MSASVVDVTVAAQPLGHRVHHPEEQAAGHERVEVAPDGTGVGGLADHLGQPVVDLAAAGEGVLLGRGVAPHAQEQGDGRKVPDEHDDAPAQGRAQALLGRVGGGGLDRVERGGELAERLVQRSLEEVLLARHVVVDRRLGEAELAGEVAHAGGVVALAVEELDRDPEDGLLVVARPAAARRPTSSAPGSPTLHGHTFPRARPDQEDHTVQDLTPRPGDLDPIETAPLEQLRTLQLERLQWSVRHAYEHVPHYRAAFDEVGVGPDDIGSLADLARLPFTTKADAARQLPVRDVRGAPRGRRTTPRVERHHRQADGRRLHPRRPRHVGRGGRAIDPCGRRTARDDPAQRLRLRPVHRRPRRPRRRRAPRLHGRARLRRDDAAPGAADPRLRARHHHGHAVLHALDHRRAGGAGRRPALHLAQGRHLRRRAVDQRHAPRDGGAHRHARRRHLRPVRGDRPRRRERVRGDQGRPARLGGPLLSRDHRPGDRRGAARR